MLRVSIKEGWWNGQIQTVAWPQWMRFAKAKPLSGRRESSSTHRRSEVIHLTVEPTIDHEISELLRSSPTNGPVEKQPTVCSRVAGRKRPVENSGRKWPIEVKDTPILRANPKGCSTSACFNWCFFFSHKKNPTYINPINQSEARVEAEEEYACPVWHSSLTADQHETLESLQKRAMRIIFNHDDYTISLIIAGFDNLQTRREHLTEEFFLRNVLNEKSPLHYLLPNKRDVNIVNRLRHAKTFELSKTRTERFKKSFIPYSLAHFQ